MDVHETSRIALRPLTLALVLGGSLAALAGCDVSEAGTSPSESIDLGYESPAVQPTAYQVPPPPLSDETFPCSDCHDAELPINRRRRELKLTHTEIELRHAEADRWCLDCHDAEDRDQLHLTSGELVPFEESYRLCGQCHGDKLRDWRVGVHGRRTGSWSGEKSYLLCVHCHDSHDPAFKPIAPMPGPRPPRRTR